MIDLQGNTATEPASKPGAWLERHHGFVEQARQGKADIVFLGDSITDHWRTAGPKGGLTVWETRLAPLKAVNFGINGDRTQHVLWRVIHGELERLHPKVVVLMIGTNNTGMELGTSIPRNTVPECVAGVRAVVTTLTSRLPNSKILVLGIFPRCESPTDAQRLQVAEINARLASVDDGKRVYFHDIGKCFLLRDGTLNRELMPDFIHPNEAGYRVWADALDPLLAALLSERG